MNKIVIIIPYFGEWPIWFDLFLYSCSRCNIIDFVFFTNCDDPATVYSNTKFIHLSYNKYCEKVSSALGIQFQPNSPYKLCDLKPFLGIVHEEMISNYDYWGFGDLDLVYGRLEYFLEQMNFRSYDIVTTHSDRVAGHFTIIRTGSKYTRICLRIKAWQKKLMDESHRGLDEDDFTRLVKPVPIKIFDLVYRLMIKRVTTNFEIQRVYSVAYKISSLFRNRVLMREMFTTFVPDKDNPCRLNLSTMELNCPGPQQSWVPGGEIMYLHFLFFKPTGYLPLEQSWKNGFFQIPSSFDYSTGGFVEISASCIKIVD